MDDAKKPSDPAARTRKGSGNLRAPVQPGEILNPRGVNQWTALRERASDLFTRQAQERIRKGDKATIAKLEAWLAHVWDDAISGNAPHLDKLIAERVLPAIQQIELTDKRESMREAPSVPATNDRLRQVADILSASNALPLEADDTLH